MGQTLTSFSSYLYDVYEFLIYTDSIKSSTSEKCTSHDNFSARRLPVYCDVKNCSEQGTQSDHIGPPVVIQYEDKNLDHVAVERHKEQQENVMQINSLVPLGNDARRPCDVSGDVTQSTDAPDDQHESDEEQMNRNSDSNGELEDSAEEQAPTLNFFLLPDGIIIPELTCEEGGIQYHAFVAHSDDYKELAHRLVENLEYVGFKCFLHSRDFIPGKYITTNIEDGINESCFVLFVLSSDFLNSSWGEFEIQMALQKCVDTKKATIIPLIVDIVVDDLPLSLKTINCIDYKDDDYWPKLCMALTVPRPLQHSLEEVIKENIELCIIRTTAVFQNLGRGDLNNELCLPAYPMDKVPRGKALIISNIEVVGQEPRLGGEKDEACLEKLFKDLHFDVVLERDVSYEGMHHAFKQMGTTVDHTGYCCFVACILSHGSEGGIYGSDGKTVSIQELAEYVDDKHCQSLQFVPKLFFIQGCLGNLRDNRLSVGHSRTLTDPEESISRRWRETYEVMEPTDTQYQDLLYEEEEDIKSTEINEENEAATNDTEDPHSEDERTQPEEENDLTNIKDPFLREEKVDTHVNQENNECTSENLSKPEETKEPIAFNEMEIPHISDDRKRKEKPQQLDESNEMNTPRRDVDVLSLYKLLNANSDVTLHDAAHTMITETSASQDAAHTMVTETSASHDAAHTMITESSASHGAANSGLTDVNTPASSNTRVQAALIPRSEDFLMSYSCLPGYMSWRNTEAGSWYCIALDKCMRKYSNPPYNWDMDRILKMVTKQVKDEVKMSAERYQFPFHVATMYRAVYLPFIPINIQKKTESDEHKADLLKTD